MHDIENRKAITADRLRELMSYDADTGEAVWLVDRGIRKRAGDSVAGATKRGYLVACIDYRRYQLHRLIWLYVHGVWPENQIDHIDQDPSNNRLENLREVDATANLRNQPRSPHNKSGFTGVCWDRARGKWSAEIYAEKKIHLGRFDNIDDAIDARKAANIKYGFHENHGKK